MRLQHHLQLVIMRLQQHLLFVFLLRHASSAAAQNPPSGCGRCGLKIECWPGEAGGAEDGLIEYTELRTLEGCARAEFRCTAPNQATVNLLRLGQVRRRIHN